MTILRDYDDPAVREALQYHPTEQDLKEMTIRLSLMNLEEVAETGSPQLKFIFLRNIAEMRAAAEAEGL